MISIQRLSVALVLVSAMACNKHDPPAPVAEGVGQGGAGATAEADTIFTTRCALCHGATGQGDGPSSAALTPHPRNFHDATWQSSVNDTHISTIIRQGGPAVGKSPLMPPNPDLVDKPAVVAALVARIRGYGGH